jgi:Mn-containing catalase
MPDISNKQFPEARKHEEKGLHRMMFRFSPEDYREFGQIWKGPHPEDGSELKVADVPHGFAPPELDAEPQLTSPVGPDMDPGTLKEIAERLFGKDTK